MTSRRAAVSRPQRIFAYGSAGLLVLAGAVCTALVVTEVGEIVAFVLVGLGLVALTGLVFLEVGLSEDRERERERREAERLKRADRPRRLPLGQMRHRRRGH